MMGCSRSKAIVEETQNGRGSNKEKKNGSATLACQ